MLPNDKAGLTREARELDPASIRRAQRGVVADQHALVRRYERAVFALVGRMLIPRGRSGLVADLAQETFLRVLKSISRFDADGPARLSTWILTIATRVVLDELRRPRLVESSLEHAAELADGNAGRIAERAAARNLVHRALASLEPDHQAVVLLCDYHELSYDDVAQSLGINAGTVKSRLSRARAAIRRLLEGEYS